MVDKKQRRKELITLYKQKREKDNSTVQEQLHIKQSNVGQYSDALAATRNNRLQEENIFDSKIFEVRPKINNTLEKRKFSTYTNLDNQSRLTVASRHAVQEPNELEQTIVEQPQIKFLPHQRIQKRSLRDTPALSNFTSAKQSPKRQEVPSTMESSVRHSN